MNDPRAQMPDERLRTSFDRSAAGYQSARPSYPAELFDELISLTGITPPARLLEIGAGPGTATADLARRGFAITAVEPGPDLAEQARHHLAGFPAVSVITSGFEQWEPTDDASYDLVYAANSWHWIDPAVRWGKTAALLPDVGHLAIFGASHALPEGFDPFFTDIQRVYDEIGAGVEDWPPPPPRLTNDGLIDEAVASGHFVRAAQRLYVWALQYDAESYIALLNTFSNHIVMEPAKRDHLYSEVRRLISARPDGLVTRHWVSQLALLRRVRSVT